MISHAEHENQEMRNLMPRHDDFLAFAGPLFANIIGFTVYRVQWCWHLAPCAHPPLRPVSGIDLELLLGFYYYTEM